MMTQLSSSLVELRGKILALRSPPRILVIDDDEMCYILFAKIMEGCDLRWAETPEKGIKLLRETNAAFDAVVVDERMPRIPGHVLIKQIREEWPDLITVLSTGYEFSEDYREKIKDLGLVLFLPKPLQTRDLETLLLFVSNK